ncbi:MAG: hypothetical protein V3R89_07795, partial [Thermoanaerobaculia bacterium]
MPTIRKRTSHGAALKVGGAPVASQTFEKEDEARAWLRQERRAAIEEGYASEDVQTELRERSTYQVQVRLRGTPEVSATFPRLTDAKRWGQATEAAIREGRHFQTTEAKRHTVAEL